MLRAILLRFLGWRRLYILYIRFMVWLGAEPPPGYEYILPQATKITPPPQPELKVAQSIPKTSSQPTPKPVVIQPAAPTKPQPVQVKPYPRPPTKKVYTGEGGALYHNLLLKALHDEGVVERLIRYERERNPRGSDVEILRAAIDSWEHDNRSGGSPMSPPQQQLPPASISPPPQLLRLDAAVPDKVQLGHAFDLAVAARQKSSPLLTEDNLQIVKSGDMRVSWSKSRSYIHLRIQVSAPDCEIHGEDSHTFRLYLGQDSPVFYFHLTPKKQGVISIIVKVYQQDDWLGSARVHTLAYKQIVGNVQLEITSHKIESTPITREDIDSIESQMIFLSRRLQKLYDIQALKGIDTEPHYLIEIEDIEKKLNELQERRRNI